MYICVDFDGTCCTHEYPEIGSDIGAIPVLKELVDNGHKIILYTMRSGEHLLSAAKYLADNGVAIEWMNENPTQVVWTSSKKVYAHLYIDDAAAGTPLVYPIHGRPYVDWMAMRNVLVDRGFLK